METEEFVGCREASRRFGISPPTLRKRVRRGELATFLNPADDRVRLLRVRDLEELMRPRPERPTEAAVSAA